jgi:hypothetical protein
MVDAMSIPDAAQPGKAREERDRQPSVHEPVVHDHIGEAERGHAGTDADRDGRGRSVQVASNHHERGRDGGMQGGERIVRFEPTVSLRVMGTMNAPERVVPHAPVEDASPGLHRRGDRYRDGEPQQHELGRRHEVTP